ncbi:hypothetical protein NW762_006134 [Fusarium torreyae]|uniref:Agmatine deiminase n=1 Tax=Fusarium torreyae TaxID=1237075 RepID=A0A9W8VFA0_9HYPO|nr:hypothetical protein NW762_006134 [Fusarium torreyae]
MSSSSEAEWYQPGEIEAQQRILMACPNSKSDSKGELLEDAQNEVINIANAIAEFEPVTLFSSSETLDKVKSQVHKNVSVLCVEETSHLWIRDFGPTFVRSRDGKLLRGVDWNFNYWGEKRAPSGDERIAKVAAQWITDIPPLAASIVAEGGAIEVDGEGTFMAAETAIINDNRNPGMSKEQVEKELSRLLGVQKFLWLAGEAGKETTDCHIDALARFIRPGVVVLSKPSPQGQGKYSFAYNNARDILSQATNAQGRKIVLHDCLEPDLGKLQRVSEGENCVASYVNFLNVNGGVIIPKFGDEERDTQALELFENLYPDRKVSQILGQFIFIPVGSYGEVMPDDVVQVVYKAASEVASEDPLHPAIWRPTIDTPQGGIPVVVSMTGGGLTMAGVGVDLLRQNPESWVECSQSHIVVSVNYRVGICDLPNARGLVNGQQYLDIIDQSAALE